LTSRRSFFVSFLLFAACTALTVFWRLGVRLGLECGYCCANLMAIQLCVGIMDLRAMTLVTAAITIERLAPGGARIARVIGAVVFCGAILTLAVTLS
jgi:predicted metal-binding membrane protein